jgi:hypothetical protein
MAEIAALVREGAQFSEDHLVIGCVLSGPPEDQNSLARVSSNKLFFLADYDGALSRSFGASAMPRTVVLDPMLRSVADIPWDIAQGHAETVRGVLHGLPDIEASAGVPLLAPVLMVPRVFLVPLGKRACDPIGAATTQMIFCACSVLKHSHEAASSECRSIIRMTPLE